MQSAIDAALNPDPTPEVLRMTVLAKPPGVTLVSTPPAVSSQTSLGIVVGVADLDPVFVDRMQFLVLPQGSVLAACVPTEVATLGAPSVTRSCAGVNDNLYRCGRWCGLLMVPVTSEHVWI